jgi:pyruvate dehydrogenase E2 component (dihydrolipoamide acetyltransferase)
VDDEKVLIKPSVNLGIAVATGTGLLVPVIEKAEQLSLPEISRAALQGAADARRGVIRSTAKGSFTITNLGMHGISRFLPIINPPECAILSVGGLEKKAVPDGAGVDFRDYLTLGLACDHRAVDGDRAARFLGCIKEKLENNLENLGP